MLATFTNPSAESYLFFFGALLFFRLEELLAVLCLIDNGWCRSQRQVHIHVRSRRQIGNISRGRRYYTRALRRAFPCRVNTTVVINFHLQNLTFTETASSKNDHRPLSNQLSKTEYIDLPQVSDPIRIDRAKLISTSFEHFSSAKPIFSLLS
ncbi:hypothetical protein CEXT_175361 [Caerostris extrusa]|uniref:Uncharacterized protein n=1 Tax=Caerostris extrusa TaxID=172846 RepID=A0AAV4PT08_CAEEX|nr:hypothetical protein CEXT_175361 [Caerostris extrusa]